MIREFVVGVLSNGVMFPMLGYSDHTAPTCGPSQVCWDVTDSVHKAADLMGKRLVLAGDRFTGANFSVEEVPAPVPTVQSAAFGYLDQHRQWVAAMNASAVNHDHNEVNKGLDYLAYGLQGVYLMLKDPSISAADKIKLCGNQARGAADVENPDQFYTKAGSIPNATGPLTWTNARYNRINLRNSRRIAGSIPIGLNIVLGQWIQEL